MAHFLASARSLDGGVGSVLAALERPASTSARS